MIEKNCENIQVMVRCRPLNQREKDEGADSCIILPPDNKKQILLDQSPGEPRKFNFDYVADASLGQDDIFQIVGKPVTMACLDGYNGCIFAYGQTGAGKTFTMQGRCLQEGRDSPLRGLQPRVFDYLFGLISEWKKAAQEEGKDKEYLVKCSYLEIYNEQIQDLLTTSETKNLSVRDDIKKGVYVENLTEEIAASSSDAIDMLMKGANNRHVGATKMNAESSRSHSVFSLNIQSREIINGMSTIKGSKLHFVDLAGSERQKQTKASGDRLKEAANINKSLTVLGQVINTLVESSGGKKRHIPYRDSKLTFILKDSLGGNSRTFMIANISEANTSFLETLGTLQFAARAKQIKNKASVNEESSGNVEALKKEIKKLKHEIEEYRIQFEKVQKNGGVILSSPCSQKSSADSKGNETPALDVAKNSLGRLGGVNRQQIREQEDKINSFIENWNVQLQIQQEKLQNKIDQCSDNLQGYNILDESQENNNNMEEEIDENDQEDGVNKNDMEIEGTSRKMRQSIVNNEEIQRELQELYETKNRIYKELEELKMSNNFTLLGSTQSVQKEFEYVQESTKKELQDEKMKNEALQKELENEKTKSKDSVQTWVKLYSSSQKNYEETEEKLKKLEGQKDEERKFYEEKIKNIQEHKQQELQKNQDNDDLNQKYQQLLSSNDDLKIVNETQQHELKTLEDKIEELKKEIEVQHQHNSEKDQEIKEIQEQKEKIRDDNLQLEQEFDKLKVEFNQLGQAFTNKNSEINEANMQVLQLEGDLDNLIKESQQTVKKNSDLKDDLMVLQSKLEDKEIENDTQKEEILRKDAEIQELNDYYYQGQEKLKEKNNQYQQLELQNQQMNQKLNEYLEKCEQISQEQINLQVILEQANDKIQVQNEEIGKLQNSKNILEGDKQNLYQEKIELNKEIQNMKNANQVCSQMWENQINDLKQQLEQYMNKFQNSEGMNQLLNEKICQQQSIIKQKNQEIQQINEEKASLDEEIDEFSQQLAQKEDVNQNLQASIIQIQQQFQETSLVLKELQKTNNDVSLENQNLQKSLEDSKITNQQLQNENNIKNTEILKNKDMIKQLYEEVEVINQKNIQIGSQLDDQKQVCLEQKSKIEQIEQENQELQESHIQLKGVNDYLGKEIEEQQIKINENSKYKEEVDSKNLQIQETVQQLQQQENELIQKDEELDEKQNSIMKYKDELEKLTNQSQIMGENNNSLNAQLTKISQDLQKYQEQNQKLSMENLDIKQQYNEQVEKRALMEQKHQEDIIELQQKHKILASTVGSQGYNSKEIGELKGQVKSLEEMLNRITIEKSNQQKIYKQQINAISFDKEKYDQKLENIMLQQRIKDESIKKISQKLRESNNQLKYAQQRNGQDQNLQKIRQQQETIISLNKKITQQQEYQKTLQDQIRAGFQDLKMSNTFQENVRLQQQSQEQAIVIQNINQSIEKYKKMLAQNLEYLFKKSLISEKEKLEVQESFNSLISEEQEMENASSQSSQGSLMNNHINRNNNNNYDMHLRFEKYLERYMQFNMEKQGEILEKYYETQQRKSYAKYEEIKQQMKDSDKKMMGINGPGSVNNSPQEKKKQQQYQQQSMKLRNIQNSINFNTGTSNEKRNFQNYIENRKDSADKENDTNESNLQKKIKL